MIELKEINKSFERVVIKDFSYKFDNGKLYVIKGVSGCGKSTLLNIIGGIETDYTGLYLENGEPFTNSDGVSYIFQNSLLLADLSIRDNLLMIKQCNEEIEMYANIMNISDLLDRFPSQLSGGERQRVSIIRALLKNPKIILADEPTASLDPDNSKNIASVVKNLVSNDRIVIVATHEDCFDDLADEIIYLNYGTIEHVSVTTHTDFLQNDEKSFQYSQKSPMSVLKYLYKRGKLFLPVRKVISLALIFFILLCSISLGVNFSAEYTKSMLKKYPINVFPLEKQYYEKLKNEYDFIIFENYVSIINEDTFCLALYNEEDSGLAYPGIIELGTFPNNKNEIIVNKKFVLNVLKTQKYEQIIGKEIELQNRKYIISGVLGDLNSGEELDYVIYNPYYTLDANIAFVPYDNIKEWGQVEESNKIMVKYNNLYNENTLVEELRSLYEGPFSVWDNMIITLDSIVEFIFAIVIFIIVCAASIAILFINNEIKLDLFYRKREIGYLQIFGIDKKRILAFLLSERLVKIICSLCLATITFYIVAIFLKLFADFNGFISLPVFLIFSIAIITYNIVVFYFPCKKFLKQNVINLIT